MLFFYSNFHKGITSIGGMFCGFLSNHIDIAPNYAGTLMAITNTAATLPGIIVPIFVGTITHGNVSEAFSNSNEMNKNVKFSITIFISCSKQLEHGELYSS